MKLYQLRYLLAVVEAGSIRRAAKSLYTAQPPISRAIQQLEQELGFRLLERDSRGVRPTPAGALFIERIRGGLHEIDTAGHLPLEEHKEFRVGLIGGLLSAGELTLPIFEEFGRRHPEVAVRAVEMNFMEQAKMLARGEVDVAIVRPPLEIPGAEVIPIAEEPRCLLVGVEHRLACQDEIAMDDLRGEAMLKLNAPPEWASFWQLADFGATEDPTGEGRSIATVMELHLALARSSAAISVASTNTRFAPSPLSHAVRLRDATTSVIAVATHRRHRTPFARHFIEAAFAAADSRINDMPDAKFLG